MKKGCFLTTIATVTVLIGIGFYVFDTYGDKILDAGKEKVRQMAYNSMDEYFDKAVSNEYKDSLLVLWNDVVEQSKKMEFESGIDQLTDISLQIERAVRDSVINQNELHKIRDLIKNETDR